MNVMYHQEQEEMELGDTVTIIANDAIMPTLRNGVLSYLIPNDVKKFAIHPRVALNYRGVVLGYSGGNLPGSFRQSIWIYCNGRDYQNRPTLCEAKFVHNKDRILVLEHTKVVLVEKVIKYSYQDAEKFNCVEICETFQ